MTPETLLHARALQACMQGDLVLPDDESWDEARQAWNLAVDQRPAAVALPETADDVVLIVDFAREHGLRVAPQGTGHSAGPLGWLDETILVKTSRMRRVDVDPQSQRARVEAGALWMDVTEAVAPHGLVGLAGSSPDVGVVGYSLGGGVSWLGRKYGLSANSVIAIELVTADGRHLRVDADHEPDIFWALRGGGGSFGIVTSLDIRLYPIREVYAGWLIFPVERAREVLTAWREWTETVPDELSSVGRILNIPPLPDIPEPLRGRSVVVVEATLIGDGAQGAELLEPLRALEPELDTFATIPASTLHHLHMDPDHPVPGTGDGMMLDDLTPEAIAAATAIMGPRSPILSLEFRHAGGELARHAPGNGVLGSLDAAYLMFAVGIAPTPEAKAAVEHDVTRLQRALARWDSGRMYLNFAEHPRSGRSLFGDDAYARLRRLKSEIDPDNVFHANHQVEPAERRSRRPAKVATPERRAA
jgi:FAD/FMN-containing dehydrogenase